MDSNPGQSSSRDQLKVESWRACELVIIEAGDQFAEAAAGRKPSRGEKATMLSTTLYEERPKHIFR